MSDSKPITWHDDPAHFRRTSRRDFLYAGLVGGLGLTMGDYFKLRANETDIFEPTAQSIIHIFLPGGSAHQETWDPKPLAPIEYRGPLSAIDTAIPGVKFSQHLQRTAKIADRLTIIRSMTHGEAAHERGTHNMFTGYRPSPAIRFPSFGAVVSHELGSRNNLPPYVCVPGVPNEFAGTGYLSSSAGAFELNADPGARGEFKVRDLTLSKDVTPAHLERRGMARQIIEARLRALNADTAKLETMDGFYKNAFSLLTSENARRAFEISEESDATRDLYGRGYTLKQNAPAAVGERLLLARRLVEADVRFVSVNYGSWDSHVDIKGTCNEHMPALDHAITGLITDLDQRGLLDTTLVMVTTEFGRTPKVNSSNGRDHWARVYSMLLAVDLSEEQRALRAFDLTSSFGPCIGLTRLER